MTLAVRIQVSEAHVNTGSSSIQLKYSKSASFQKRREAFVITFSFVRYSVIHHHFSYLTMDSEYLDRAAFGLSVASAMNVVDPVLEVAELLKVRKSKCCLILTVPTWKKRIPSIASLVAATSMNKGKSYAQSRFYDRPCSNDRHSRLSQYRLP